MATISFLPGRVFRSRDFLKQSSNPTRFASQLVSEGRLKKLQGGLYFVPRPSRWGELPVSQDELLSKWLEGRRGRDWVITGSTVWNALRLGSTGVQARTLVYNKKRSGLFRIGGHSLELRRVPFPHQPSAEWFAVDYLNNLNRTDGSAEEAARGLRKAFASGRLAAQTVDAMAERFGSKAVRALVDEASASCTK